MSTQMNPPILPWHLKAAEGITDSNDFAIQSYAAETLRQTRYGLAAIIAAHDPHAAQRRQQAYDTGQHQLVCADLGVSPDPDAPGDTAHEAVMLLKQQHAETVRLLERALPDIALTDGTGFVNLEAVELANEIRAHLRTLRGEKGST